jgi:hypothetical protein
MIINGERAAERKADDARDRHGKQAHAQRQQHNLDQVRIERDD